VIKSNKKNQIFWRKDNSIHVELFFKNGGQNINLQLELLKKLLTYYIYLFILFIYIIYLYIYIYIYIYI